MCGSGAVDGGGDAVDDGAGGCGGGRRSGSSGGSGSNGCPSGAGSNGDLDAAAAVVMAVTEGGMHGDLLKGEAIDQASVK